MNIVTTPSQELASATPMLARFRNEPAQNTAWQRTVGRQEPAELSFAQRRAEPATSRDDGAELRAAMGRVAALVRVLAEDGAEPALIAQVREAVGNSTGAGGGGGALANTKSPMNESARDLLDEMTLAARQAQGAATGSTPGRYVDPELALLIWLPWAQGQVAAGTELETVLAWERMLRGLVNSARQLLTPMRRLEITLPCPSCAAVKHAGNSALSAPILEGTGRLLVVCGACGWEAEGVDQLEALAA